MVEVVVVVGEVKVVVVVGVAVTSQTYRTRYLSELTARNLMSVPKWCVELEVSS